MKNCDVLKPKLVGTVLCMLFASMVDAKTIPVTGPQDLVTAMGSIAAGDQLLFSPGIYSGVRLEIRQPNVQVRALEPGKTIFTGSTRVTIMADGVNLSGLAFSEIKETPVINIVSGSASSVTESAFINNGSEARSTQHIVRIHPAASAVTVSNSYFSGSRAMSVGVVLRSGQPGSFGHVISHNIFSDIPAQQKNGFEAIQIGQSREESLTNTNVLIEGNVFNRVEGDAEIISLKSSSNIVRKNAFINNQNGSLTLREGKGNSVEGNCFSGNKIAMRVYGIEHRIVNNLFRGNEFAIGFLDGARNAEQQIVHQAAKNILVEKNDFVSNQSIFRLTGKRVTLEQELIPERITLSDNLLQGKMSNLSDTELNFRGMFMSRSNRGASLPQDTSSLPEDTIKICSQFLAVDLIKGGPAWGH